MKSIQLEKNVLLESLKKIRVLQYLEANEIENIAEVCEVLEYPEKDVIVHEGDISLDVYAVIQGTVSVMVNEPDGKQVYICSIGEGEIFGEAGLFVNVKRTADVIALDAVRVIRIERKNFIRFIKTNLRGGMTILLLIIPVQASLLAPLSLGGIKPDLALALLYVIGLLTGPLEAALAGMAIGLVQDIGSASFIGFSGLTRGLIGFSAGLLGRQVLDLTSPSNSIVLAAFSLLEGLVIAFFLQMFYGDVPFFGLTAGRILPQALYTGVLGAVLLKLVVRKDVMSVLVRRDVQKEL